MYRLIIFLFLFIFLISCVQTPDMADQTEANKTEYTLTYDSTLAKKFGADDYGMKRYVIAFLKRGPNRSQDSATANWLQRAHLDNIGRLAAEGKLVLAGPFFGNGDLRGIYIFDVKTVEEAQKLTETDPAIQEGRLVMELLPWYGSAALMNVNELHKRIAKSDI